ncbi:hypothetical protein CBL_10273 [Carabus blaptoides fortunei]
MALRIFCHLPIWLLCIVHCANSEIPEDWVDPHDMSPSADYLSFTDGQLPLNDYYKDRKIGSTNCICDLSDKKFEAFLKRTINLLLNAVHEDNVNDDNYAYSGHLFFKINAENFEMLRNFANGFDENADLVKIDAILSELLTKPTNKYVQEFLESYFRKFLNVLLTKQGIVTVVCCTYLYVIYRMFLANFYWFYVMNFLLFNFVIFDFIFTWVHLYKKAEIEKMTYRSRYKELPLECNPEKLDSWQFFWNVFSKEDACMKYHEVNYQDIFWTISPGLVVSEMFSDLVKGPLLTLGRAFSDTCGHIFGAIPWPFNIIIFPVALVFLCILVGIILTFIFKGNVKLNLFYHLLSFSVSGHNPQNEYRLTNQRIEELEYHETHIIREAAVQTGRHHLQINDTTLNNVRLGELSKCEPGNSKVETLTDNEQVSEVVKESEDYTNRREISSAKGDYVCDDVKKKNSEPEPNLTTGAGDG